MKLRKEINYIIKKQGNHWIAARNIKINDTLQCPYCQGEFEWADNYLDTPIVASSFKELLQEAKRLGFKIITKNSKKEVR